MKFGVKCIETDMDDSSTSKSAEFDQCSIDQQEDAIVIDDNAVGFTVKVSNTTLDRGKMPLKMCPTFLNT